MLSSYAVLIYKNILSIRSFEDKLHQRTLSGYEREIKDFYTSTTKKLLFRG